MWPAVHGYNIWVADNAYVQFTVKSIVLIVFISLLMPHAHGKCSVMINYGNQIQLSNPCDCNESEETTFAHATTGVPQMNLTHWGRVTHICVDNLTINASDNGLSPGRRQAIIWTNAGILLIEPLGTKFSEILIEIYTFSFKKMHLNISSAKGRPFCLEENSPGLLASPRSHPANTERNKHVIITSKTSFWRNDYVLLRSMFAWHLQTPNRRVLFKMYN